MTAALLANAAALAGVGALPLVPILTARSINRPRLYRGRHRRRWWRR
jgi:hypothetical protein